MDLMYIGDDIFLLDDSPNGPEEKGIKLEIDTYEKEVTCHKMKASEIINTFVFPLQDDKRLLKVLSWAVKEKRC